jgi:zinc finger SWIM domain-containing protein 3
MVSVWWADTKDTLPANTTNVFYSSVYIVYHFVSQHRYPLATDQQSHQLRSQRKICETHISRIEVAKSVGISTKEAIDLLAKEAGGMENLGFTRLHWKNRLYTKRSLKVHQGNTGGVLEYMEKKRSKDAKFFYSIQVDEDDFITNVF